MRQDFLATVRPFLFYSQIFGLSPVKLQGKRFRVSWPGALYSLMLIAGLWFPFYYAYLDQDIFILQRLDVERIWKTTFVIIGPICSALILSSSIASCRSFSDVINKLALHDDKSKKQIGELRYGRMKHVFLWTSAVCHAGSFYYSYNENYFVQHFYSHFGKVMLPFPSTVRYLLTSAAWAVFDVVSWPQILNNSYLFYLVYRKFHLINAQLDATLSDYEKLNRKKIRDKSYFASRRMRQLNVHRKLSNKVAHIRHLHTVLVGISLQLSDVLSSKLLIIIAFNLVQLCIATFICLATYFSGIRGYFFTTSVSFVCNRLLAICVLVIPFSWVTDEANLSSVTVNRALNKEMDRCMQEELLSFSLLLENRKLRFTALKMFDLGKGTVRSVMQLAASYMFIILQLQVTFYFLSLKTQQEMEHIT